MKDCRKELIKALITALKTALGTSIKIYTKVPKGDFSNPVAFPFVYITDIEDSEDGTKSQFIYDYRLTIEIVYSGLSDKAVIWETANKVKGIFNNCVPFALGDDLQIMKTEMTGTSESEDLIGSMEVDVIRVGVNFTIEDNN